MIIRTQILNSLYPHKHPEKFDEQVRKTLEKLMSISGSEDKRKAIALLTAEYCDAIVTKFNSYEIKFTYIGR